jgi:hypothetical protein
MKIRILTFVLISIANLNAATFTDYYNSLKKHEKMTTSVVLNKDGEKVIGAGINLDKHFPGNNYKVGQNLAISQIDNITFNVVKKAESEAKILFPNFNSSSERLKIILVTLVVLRGENVVKNRSRFVSAINAKDYKKAAVELRNFPFFSFNNTMIDGFADELEKM